MSNLHSFEGWVIAVFDSNSEGCGDFNGIDDSSDVNFDTCFDKWYTGCRTNPNAGSSTRWNWRKILICNQNLILELVGILWWNQVDKEDLLSPAKLINESATCSKVRFNPLFTSQKYNSSRQKACALVCISRWRLRRSETQSLSKNKRFCSFKRSLRRAYREQIRPQLEKSTPRYSKCSENGRKDDLAELQTRSRSRIQVTKHFFFNIL